MSAYTRSVQVYRGLYTIILTLDETPTGYEVNGTSYYRTSYGARVEGSKTFAFSTLEKAREKANSWYFGLLRRGWERVPEKR